MIKVYSLKNGDLLFAGDPKRPSMYLRSRILTEGAHNISPEDLARELEDLACSVRNIGRTQ